MAWYSTPTDSLDSPPCLCDSVVNFPLLWDATALLSCVQRHIRYYAIRNGGENDDR